MLKHYFTYQLHPVWLVYMPSAKRLGEEKSLGGHGILYLSLTLVLPYIITVCMKLYIHWTPLIVIACSVHCIVFSDSY